MIKESITLEDLDKIIDNIRIVDTIKINWKNPIVKEEPTTVENISLEDLEKIIDDIKSIDTIKINWKNPTIKEI